MAVYVLRKNQRESERTAALPPQRPPPFLAAGPAPPPLRPGPDDGTGQVLRRDPGLDSQHAPPRGVSASEMAVWPSIFQSTELLAAGSPRKRKPFFGRSG